MAEIKVGKRKLSINLSFLALTDTIKHARPQKSPKKKFEHPNGVVGLGILAALNHHHHHQDPVFIKTSVLGLSPLSNPIRILSSKSFCKGNNISEKKLSVEEMELCEEYTCVISHAGDKFIKKREYFEADILVNDDVAHKVFSVVNGSGGEVSDFLNSCFLCGKMLHGLDIFMYRGEKAFCSAECRNMQISKDEQTEKCRSEARKPKKYSVSPCTGTLEFYGGVTAA